VIAHPSNLVLPYCPQSCRSGVWRTEFTLYANRIGTEQRKRACAHVYRQSQITSPRAEILARADADEEVLLTADLAWFARDKKLNQYNDLFRTGRPTFISPDAILMR